MWPWDLSMAITLTMNFKVKFGICYISTNDGLIATEWKICIKNELKASMTIKFDLGNDIETWGARIYQIVTVVTSDIGMPLTWLVN